MIHNRNFAVAVSNYFFRGERVCFTVINFTERNALFKFDDVFLCGKRTAVIERFRALYAANAGFVIFCRFGISGFACKIGCGNNFLIENVSRFIGNFLAFFVFAFVPVIVFISRPFGGKLMFVSERNRYRHGACRADAYHARQNYGQQFVSKNPVFHKNNSFCFFVGSFCPKRVIFSLTRFVFILND